MAMMAKFGPSDKICGIVCRASYHIFGPMGHICLSLSKSPLNPYRRSNDCCVWLQRFNDYRFCSRFVFTVRPCLYLCIVFSFFFFHIYFVSNRIITLSYFPRPTLWDTKQVVQHREHWRHLRISRDSPPPGTLVVCSFSFPVPQKAQVVRKIIPCKEQAHFLVSGSSRILIRRDRWQSSHGGGFCLVYRHLGCVLTFLAYTR